MVDYLQGVINGFFAGIGFFAAEWIYKKYLEKNLVKLETKRNQLINGIKELRNK